MQNEEDQRRIRELESSLEKLTQRLEVLENKVSNSPPPVPAAAIAKPVVPPPILTPAPEKVAEILRPKTPDWFADDRKAPPIPKQDADAIEYKWGINGLLRGGAVVIIFAFLFLVAMMIGRGYVTPPIQFAGELLLCAGFIGVGIWKHDEKDDFGQLMCGLGSFGLYASFAGAHVYKHLYEGETLVALYVLLSFANLGFSHWRSSKSFLTIGLLGGLAASMMPMQKDNVPLSLGLHFLILIPAALVILKNKWNEMAALMWFMSSLALIWPTTTGYDHLMRVGAVYLACAITLYSYGKSFKSSPLDVHSGFLTTAMVLTGFYAIAIDSGHKGSLHAAVLTLIGLAIGYLMGENTKPKYASWLGALIVFAIITPLGFTQKIAAFYYGFEALVLIVLALRFRLVALWAVGFFTFAFALVAYTFYPDKMAVEFAVLTQLEESALLVLFSATALLNIRYAMRQKTDELGDIALFLGSTLLVAFFIRSLNMFLGSGTTVLSTEDTALLGVGISSVAAVVLGTIIKRPGLYAFSAIVVVLASFGALLREPSATPQWVTVVMLFLAATSVSLGGVHLIRQKEKEARTQAIVVMGIALSGFFIRMSQVAGTHSLLGLNSETIIYLGLAILNVVWTGLAWKTRSVGHFTLAWLSFGFAACGEFQLAEPSSPIWYSPLLLFVPIVTLTILYIVTPRKAPEEGVFTGGVVLAAWILTTAFLQQELGRAWIGLKPVAAFTVSWVILAVILIVAGFKFDRRFLRYGSLVIFATTVGKVFLVDLAELDSFVRVLMLMLLGFGMVGGGYWYILWRRGAKANS